MVVIGIIIAQVWVQVIHILLLLGGHMVRSVVHGLNQLLLVLSHYDIRYENAFLYFTVHDILHDGLLGLILYLAAQLSLGLVSLLLAQHRCLVVKALLSLEIGVDLLLLWHLLTGCGSYGIVLLLLGLLLSGRLCLGRLLLELLGQ